MAFELPPLVPLAWAVPPLLALPLPFSSLGAAGTPPNAATNGALLLRGDTGSAVRSASPGGAHKASAVAAAAVAAAPEAAAIAPGAALRASAAAGDWFTSGGGGGSVDALCGVGGSLPRHRRVVQRQHATRSSTGAAARLATITKLHT